MEGCHLLWDPAGRAVWKQADGRGRRRKTGERKKRMGEGGGGQERGEGWEREEEDKREEKDGRGRTMVMDTNDQLWSHTHYTTMCTFCPTSLELKLACVL